MRTCPEICLYTYTSIYAHHSVAILVKYVFSVVWIEMTSVVWIIMTSVVWIAAPLPDSRPFHQNLKFAPWDRPDDVLNDRVLLCPPLVDGKILWPDGLYEVATEAGVDLLQSLPLAIYGQHIRLIGLARLSSRGVQLHQGPLTNPERESRLLLDIFHHPMDAASVKVIDRVELANPIEFRHRAFQTARSSRIEPSFGEVVLIPT